MLDKIPRDRAQPVWQYLKRYQWYLKCFFCPSFFPPPPPLVIFHDHFPPPFPSKIPRIEVWTQSCCRSVKIHQWGRSAPLPIKAINTKRPERPCIGTIFERKIQVCRNVVLSSLNQLFLHNKMCKISRQDFFTHRYND